MAYHAAVSGLTRPAFFSKCACSLVSGNEGAIWRTAAIGTMGLRYCLKAVRFDLVVIAAGLPQNRKEEKDGPGKRKNLTLALAPIEEGPVVQQNGFFPTEKPCLTP